MNHLRFVNLLKLQWLVLLQKNRTNITKCLQGGDHTRLALMHTQLAPAGSKDFVHSWYFPIYFFLKTVHFLEAV